MHDPKVKPTGALHLLMPDGFDLILNNKAEISLARLLASTGYAKTIHGQTYAVPFVKPWAHTPSPYYPDFIVYNYANQIVFIEMKSIMGMCQDENIAKYGALASFCRKKGYLYGMFDVEGLAFEEYLWPFPDDKVTAYFHQVVASQGGFNQNNLNALLTKTPPKKRASVKREISSLILQDPYLQNRYCHDDPELVNAVRLDKPLPYKKFS